MQQAQAHFMQKLCNVHNHHYFYTTAFCQCQQLPFYLLHMNKKQLPVLASLTIDASSRIKHSDRQKGTPASAGVP
jgi:hypothetical protein